MLMKVLKIIASGSSYSNKSIAKRLGIDEGMVKQLIEHLKHMGYIKESSKMDSACDLCSKKNIKSCCSHHNLSFNVIELTKKGHDALAAL